MFRDILMPVSFAFILVGMLSGSIFALILFFVWWGFLLNPTFLKSLPDKDRE